MRKYLPTKPQWKEWSLLAKLLAVCACLVLPLSIIILGIVYFSPFVQPSPTPDVNLADHVQGPVIQQGPNSSFDGDIVIGASQIALTPVPSTSVVTPVKNLSPTITPSLIEPARDEETLIIVTEFSNRSDHDYDASGAIYESLERALTKYNLSDVRIERVNESFGRGDYAHVRRFGDVYKASLVIWGSSNDGGLFPRISVINDARLPALNDIPKFTQKISDNLFSAGFQRFLKDIDNEEFRIEIQNVLYEKNNTDFPELQELSKQFAGVFDLLHQKRTESILDNPHAFADSVLNNLTDLTDPPRDFTFYVNQELPDFISYFSRLIIAIDLLQKHKLMKASILLNDLEGLSTFHDYISTNDYASTETFRKSLANVYALRAGVYFVNTPEPIIDFTSIIDDLNKSINLEPDNSSYYLFRAIFLYINSASSESPPHFNSSVNDLICFDIENLIEVIEKSSDGSSYNSKADEDNSATVTIKGLQNLLETKCVLSSNLMIFLDISKAVLLSANGEGIPLLADDKALSSIATIIVIYVGVEAFFERVTWGEAIFVMSGVLLVFFADDILDEFPLDFYEKRLDDPTELYSVLIALSEILFDYESPSFCTLIETLPLHSLYFYRGIASMQINNLQQSITDFESYTELMSGCPLMANTSYFASDIYDYEVKFTIQKQVQQLFFRNPPPLRHVLNQLKVLSDSMKN